MRMTGGDQLVDAVLTGLRRHDEAKEAKTETIRMVGSKVSSGKVKKATKRLCVRFDYAHALTPRVKQVMQLWVKDVLKLA